jgi:predicted O-methyltransferase YrrM
LNRLSFINQLREYGAKNTIPNISKVNTKFICDLIKISKTKTMLEI